MSGLFLVGDATFNSLAVGAIVVVAVAVLGSITVLPALLVKLGRWVDRPRVPLLWRLNARIGRGGISRRLLGAGAPPSGRRARLSAAWSSPRSPCRRWGCGCTPATSTPCPRPSPRCRPCATITAAFPAEGAAGDGGGARAVGRPQRAVAARARRPREPAVATGDFVGSGAGAARGRASEDGRTTGAADRDAVRRVRRAGRRRAAHAARRPGARGVRRRSDRRSRPPSAAGPRRTSTSPTGSASGCRW